MANKRWPSWVYGDGTEPDVRFSFANERTFLAWNRTALALLAAGVAIDSLDLSLTDRAQRLLAIVMVVLGLLCAVASWIRWARAERAMRHSQPLPASVTTPLLACGITLAAILLLLVGL